MRVAVEKMPEVKLGNVGIFLRIRQNDGTNVGKLWVGQAKVRWARGNVPYGNAKEVPVAKLIEFLDQF